MHFLHYFSLVSQHQTILRSSFSKETCIHGVHLGQLLGCNRLSCLQLRLVLRVDLSATAAIFRHRWHQTHRRVCHLHLVVGSQVKSLALASTAILAAVLLVPASTSCLALFLRQLLFLFLRQLLFPFLLHLGLFAAPGGLLALLLRNHHSFLLLFSFSLLTCECCLSPALLELASLGSSDSLCLCGGSALLSFCFLASFQCPSLPLLSCPFDRFCLFPGFFRCLFSLLTLLLLCLFFLALGFSDCFSLSLIGLLLLLESTFTCGLCLALFSFGLLPSAVLSLSLTSCVLLSAALLSSPPRPQSSDP